MSSAKTDFPDHFSLKEGKIDSTVFVADSACVVGQVFIEEKSSVWYNTVLRADLNRIYVGQRSNIQDGCILHLENDLPCVVGNDVTVGHGAILHACEISDAVLIGMGAIVLNGAKIGAGAVIAAGSVVKEGQVVPECTMWAGVPAKQLKVLDQSSIENNKRWAAKYVRLAQKHRDLAQ